MEKANKPKRKYHLDELIGSFLLAVMALITFANVLNRYIFKSSLAYTEEVVVNGFVWITLLGISIAFRRGSHLQMTNLYDKLPYKLKKAVTVFSAIIGIGIFGYLIANSIRDIYRNITIFNTLSEALFIPTWIYTMGTPIFSVFVIVEIVRNMIRTLKAHDEKEAAKASEGGK